MRDHSMIRAYGITFDMPCSVQYFNGFDKRPGALRKLLPEGLNLNYGWVVGDQNAARSQRALQMRHHSPWFRQVEYCSIKPRVVVFLVSIAELDLIRVEDVGA